MLSMGLPVPLSVSPGHMAVIKPAVGQELSGNDGSSDLVGMHPVPGHIGGMSVLEISIESRLDVHQDTAMLPGQLFQFSSPYFTP